MTLNALCWSLLATLLLLGCAQKPDNEPQAVLTPLPPSAVAPFAPLLSEQHYAQQMEQVLAQQQRSQLTGHFVGQGQQTLHYQHFPVHEPVASLLLVHGFSESILKFSELIHYFNGQGYEVFALEHRGHARSGRLGADSSQVHVDSWQYYVDDLQAFVQQIVRPQTQAPLLLYAHSMGGAIATALMAREPEWFQAAVLTAPMMAINTGHVGGYGAGAVASLWTGLGQSQRYMLGQGPYQNEAFTASVGTHSQARYQWYQSQVQQQPELQHGGGSYGWLRQGLLLTRHLSQQAPLESVQTPVRLYQAELDDLVLPAQQISRVNAMPNGDWVLVSGAKHDLYRETNAWLGSYLADLFAFYQLHLPQPATSSLQAGE